MVKTALIFLTSLSAIISNCQEDLTFQKETHSFDIQSLDTYNSSVLIEGNNPSDFIQRIRFPIGDLSKVESIEIREWKRNKWVKSPHSEEISTSSMSWSSFFSGTVYYTLKLSPQKKFQIKILTNAKHSIFISKIYQEGYFNADTVHYNFNIPKGIKSTFSNGLERKNNFQITSDDYSDSVEYLNLLIHPDSVVPSSYFAKWFNSKIEPQLVISGDIIPKVLLNIQQTKSKEELAEACFRFVQNEIKYIDVENGINAIVPRQCESTLRKGLGDCKDMATLLTAFYRYFGFDAYVSISRTNSKSGTFNFPSVSLANHAICVLKLKDEWYFLDPTEDICLFGDPSTQTLGTETFLIGNSDVYFLNVPNKTRSNSDASLTYEINEETETIEMRLVASGKMNQNFSYIGLMKNDPKPSVTKILNLISGLKWNIDSLNISQQNSFLIASCPLPKSSYSKVSSKVIYDLSFLPSPKNICLLFQNNSHPLFDSEFNLVLSFNGELATSSILENATYTKDSLSVKYTLKTMKDDESFSESSFFINWNSIFLKPLTIKY